MAIKTAPSDPAEYLTTPIRIPAYLEAAFDDGDPALIATALGNIAHARGMTQLVSAPASPAKPSTKPSRPPATLVSPPSSAS